MSTPTRDTLRPGDWVEVLPEPEGWDEEARGEWLSGAPKRLPGHRYRVENIAHEEGGCSVVLITPCGAGFYWLRPEAVRRIEPEPIPGTDDLGEDEVEWLCEQNAKLLDKLRDARRQQDEARGEVARLTAERDRLHESDRYAREARDRALDEVQRLRNRIGVAREVLRRAVDGDSA